MPEAQLGPNLVGKHVDKPIVKGDNWGHAKGREQVICPESFRVSCITQKTSSIICCLTEAREVSILARKYTAPSNSPCGLQYHLPRLNHPFGRKEPRIRGPRGLHYGTLEPLQRKFDAHRAIRNELSAHDGQKVTILISEGAAAEVEDTSDKLRVVVHKLTNGRGLILVSLIHRLQARCRQRH